MTPHEGHKAGLPVVLRDARGIEVPAEYVSGPRDDGFYFWRILGKHQRYKGGGMYPIGAFWWLPPDGAWSGHDARLIVKDADGWTYHTPARDGDAHPDWREGMEWGVTDQVGNSPGQPAWFTNYTYRFRPARETVEDVPVELVDEIRKQLGPKFKHLAEVTAAEYLKYHKPAPADPHAQVAAEMDDLIQGVGSRQERVKLMADVLRSRFDGEK